LDEFACLSVLVADCKLFLLFSMGINVYIRGTVLLKKSFRSRSRTNSRKMNMVKLVFYLILILALTTMHCKAGKSIKKKESTAKGVCVPLGGLCEQATDCCGRDDPDSGHCIGCWQHGGYFITWGRHRCGCDGTASVTIDPNTHLVTSDICNGRDANRDRCATRVARSGDSNARGKKLFWYVN
jgi:hypothetical protein